jgi:hypothetical protein
MPRRRGIHLQMAACQDGYVISKVLQDVLLRVEDWPEVAQVELAEIALEIDAGLCNGPYHATPNELEGIDRGLNAAREGSFATDDQVRRAFQKSRPA